MKIALLLALAAIALVAIACGGSTNVDDTDAVRTNEVTLKDSEFSPAVISVAPGTEVTWTWNDGNRKHDVSGDGWSSKIMEEGTFTQRFDEPGIYDYRCTLHSGMKGRVIVEQ
jgi:plastocyanin